MGEGVYDVRNISIHALHEESDVTLDWDVSQREISIHALHEESDAARYKKLTILGIFQPTLSMRRATCHANADRLLYAFQSALSMRRATDCCDLSSRLSTFQSTLSMRRATWREHPRLGALYISIHALHEESDSETLESVGVDRYFNPRSP